MGKIVLSIDPVTRLEGHLKVQVAVENGVVSDAWITGGMYRGFESILRGRAPRDATQIVQRICGVCPVAHATASALALEQACGTVVPNNGRIVRNLMLGANYLQSNILHFYHLAGQDYFMGPETVPFQPRYPHPDLRLSPELNALAVDEYLEALQVRQICHEMVALFGGRMPHVQGLLAGGAAEMPSRSQLLECAARLVRVREFVTRRYLPLVYAIGAQYPDMYALAHGYCNALCVGVFPEADGSQLFEPGVYIEGKDQPFKPELISESVRYSWFDGPNTETSFMETDTEQPHPGKTGAYSFIKAPSYAGKRVEVGPLARMWINNCPLSPFGREALWKQFGIRAETLRDLGEERAFSIMGRNIARAEEVYLMVEVLGRWLREAEPDGQTFALPEVPASGEGIGFTEAPRGALMHAVRIADHVIADYVVIAASMWNCSPRDSSGQRGPVEEALRGLPVPYSDSPVNVGRVIRAYDP